MFVGSIKIPPKSIEFRKRAATTCSRRLRGLSPLPVSPLVCETNRTQASSLSTLPVGAPALPESPLGSPSVLRRSRRSSVIVHSNPNSVASSPQSGEWDGYCEQPTFWNSRFGWINQPDRIKLVSTESESSIEVGSELAEELYNLVDDKGNQKMAEDLSKHISDLKKIYGAIKAEILLFSPDDFTEAATSLLPGHLDSLKKLFVSLSTSVDELEELFPAEVAIIQEWKIKLTSTRDNISTNRRLLMEKNQSFVRTIPPPSPINLSTASIESQMSIMKLNEGKTISDNIAKADDDYQEVVAEIDSLEEDMKEHFEEVDTIKDKDDSLIRVAMREVSDWKKRKQQVAKAYRKYISFAERIIKALQAETETADCRPDAATDLDSLKTDKEEKDLRKWRSSWILLLKNLELKTGRERSTLMM